MIAKLDDFRGGYFTDVPSSLLKPNELLQAENCTASNGLTKRNGISKYSTTSLTGTIRGIAREQFNSTYYTIIAVDNASTVTFYQGTATTFTSVTGVNFTTGSDVQMAYLNGYLVAVNGTDKPAILYYDSGFQLENLETLDTRTLADSDWWAGQYDASETPPYIDDTTDAQDSDADDFQIASTTNSDGFYFASNFAFNKIILTSASQFAGSPVASYEYWNGSTWTSLDMVTTPTWTDAAGDRTLEWNFPQDWEQTPSSEGSTSDTTNRWTIRVRFTTAPSGAATCDYATLYHTQKLTEIMQGDIPHDVFVHKSHIFLAAGYNLQYTYANSVINWPSHYVETFPEGGPTIKGMASCKDRLLVFKDNALWEYTGNSFETFVKRHISNYGCSSTRSVAVVGDECYRVYNDGIYGWSGSRDGKVSKHIQSDIDDYTLTDSCAVSYKNQYWVCFPTNEIALVFDPDTARQDEMGDTRVSFFKFTNYLVNEFVYCSDSGDTGFLLAISNQATPYIARCDNGSTDSTPSVTNIDMKIKTSRLDAISGGHTKRYTRIKPVVKQDSSSSTTYTFTMYADDEARSDSVTLSVDLGTGTYSEDVSLSYELDGKNLSLYLRNNTAQTAGLIAYYFEYAGRRF